MRSHAKAATAGSNSGWGTSRGSRRRSGTLAGLIVALIATACFLPGASHAAETRQQIESFGADGTSGSTFEFSSALAFDQGNDRLYALDQTPAKIYGFDASVPGAHTPLAGGFPLTAPGSEAFWTDDLAVDSDSHDIYFVSEGKAFFGEPSLYGFDSSGAPLAGFPIGGFSDSCGAAVDPSGNVWASDKATQEVKGYDPSGNPIGSIDTSAQGGPCHIAFDSEANLYVSLSEGGTWRYPAAGGYTSATEVDPIPGSFPISSSAVAVDRSTDQLYVAHSNRVSVWDSSGTFLYEFGGTVPGAQYTGIAIDEGADQVYLYDLAGFEPANMRVHVFGAPVLIPEPTTEDAEGVTATTATLHGSVNPEGEQLIDCHFEYGTTNSYGESADCVPAAASIPADSSKHAVSADLSGLSAGTTYHFRLVAGTAQGSANGADRVLTTAIGPPTVSAQSVEAVGLTDATLSAKINPKGAKTTYHVEYGTTSSYGQSTAESAPIGFANDDSEHTVKVHIGGLSAGSAYHFRFAATSAAGNGEGADTTFATHPAPPGVGACPNDAFRTGFGSRLPDCRAYEQATPTDKHGANIQGNVNAVQASSAGDRVTFYLNGGLPTSGGNSTLSAYMASRGPGGWASDGLLPATDPGYKAFVSGWSEDLSTSLATAEGPGGEALYLRDAATGKYQPTVPGPGNVIPADFAADTRHLIFEAEADLLPGVPSFKRKLYDLDHGALALVGRVPASGASCDDVNGPACVIAAGDTFAGSEKGIDFSGNAYPTNTLSQDGSKAIFSVGGQLYVREDGTRTTRVSASQAAVPDPNGQKPATFMGATPDGSKVFFLSCEKLTDDSTAVSTAANSCTTNTTNPDFSLSPDQGRDLYSYDTDTGELTDLTVDPNVSDERRAGVQGVLGASEDSSHIYFVANGVLASGASAGNCLKRSGGLPLGECSLYVSRNGTTRFIARLDASGGNASDSYAWEGGGGSSPQRYSRVSADGSIVLFGSHQNLTGFPHVGEKGGLYRYSADEDELTCVSCNLAGAPVSGDATFGTARAGFFLAPSSIFLTRNLSADGNRAFFESTIALLPSDTNGVRDVYEWEAKGSGSCKSESQNGGCLYLLSSGTSPEPSYFADASTDGDHVFLFTSQRLVPSDRDELIDIYDAGVGAGLASQHALAPATCTGTACQSNPPPPPDPTMASAAFQGPGNVKKRPAARKCPKGKRKVRRAGKVRCQKTGKKASKKASKKHKRHSNRGGSK